MNEPERQMARAVLAENLRVRKGESVVIETWPHALPYARAMVMEARRLGAQPLLLLEDEEAWWGAVERKQFGPLSTLSDSERAAIRAADVFVHFWGPPDTPRFARLPPAVQTRLTAWNEEWYRLARRAGLRGCRMTVGQASDPVASMFGLDGPSWRSRLVRAGGVSGRRMAKKGIALVRALEQGSALRVRHRNGTDLTIHLEGLHSVISTGLVTAADQRRPYGVLTNNPSGQVMVGIDRSGATGRFVSNRTVYLGSARFGGADWTFENGRLGAHALGLGGKEFDDAFAKERGKDRDRLGYLSIGLNPNSRDLPPCEDTEEGAILIGIGNNQIGGGRIRLPFRGYALLGEGTLEIDGRRIAAAGRLR